MTSYISLGAFGFPAENGPDSRWGVGDRYSTAKALCTLGGFSQTGESTKTPFESDSKISCFLLMFEVLNIISGVKPPLRYDWKKSFPGSGTEKIITKQQGEPQNVASVFLNKYYKTSIISVDFLLGCLARGCLKRNPTWAFDDIGIGSLAVLLTHRWRHINKPTSKFHREPTCLWERGLYYINLFKTTHVITPKTKAVRF